MWKWFERLLGRRRGGPALRENAPAPSAPGPAPQPRAAASVRLAHPAAAPAVRTGLPADLLQFGQAAIRSTATPVVIGLDLGTSSTKVVLRTPYKLSGRCFPVRFDRLAHRRSTYLLPDRLAVDACGRASLDVKHAVNVRTGLKVSLMRSGQAEDVAWAAMFLGLVLREARRFFLSSQAPDYGPDRLRWSLNLGIPSAGYDDAIVKEWFARAASAGWLLSLDPEPPTLEAAQRAVAAGSPPHEVAIAVIPEVAAEVVGYARSHHRREGLHLMLDMGASTLDVSAFCLHRRGMDDYYEILTADVQVLGLLGLHRKRMEAADGLPPYDTPPADPVEPLPEWDERHRRAPELQACDAAFVEVCGRRVLLRMLRDLRRSRDPYSPHWREGLPIFVCGGGAEAPITSSILGFADGAARRVWEPYGGLRRELIPIPQSLHLEGGTMRPEEFSRLAVAYGLSCPEIDIGIIEPPSEIADIDTRLPQNPWKDLLD